MFESLEVDPANFLQSLLQWLKDVSIILFHPRGQTTIEAPGSPTLKKAKTVPADGKVMNSVFWEADGILIVDYPRKAHINPWYNVHTIHNFRYGKTLNSNATKNSVKLFYHRHGNAHPVPWMS